MLIKQIHRSNQGQGLFIPFLAQQYVRPICFWAKKMHIMGRTYDLDMIHQNMADTWCQSPTDLVKLPEPFKKDTK
jgi:hypothetical protein